MLTGTPLDLTPFGVVLQGIGWLYWLLAAGALYFILKNTSTRSGRLVGVGFVVVVFGALPAWQMAQSWMFKAKQSTAQAHFEMRCKSAGERIERKVEGVEGVLLMKLRPDHVNYNEQFTPDDVYGHDAGGESYIKTFLRVTKGRDIVNQFGESILPRYHVGYAWVEAADPRNGNLHRYTLVHKVVQVLTDEQQVQAKKNYPNVGRDVYGVVLEKEPIAQATARYGVDWADTSTREDREHWVAGGVLKVIDLQSNEVIAERRGYMWDYAMGSRAGARSPWGDAEYSACPPFSGKRASGTRARTMRESSDFVRTALKPIEENR